MSSSWIGASRTNQRYGHELKVKEGGSSLGRFVNGIIDGGIEDVAGRSNCDVASVRLRISSGKDVSFESLNCGRDFCEESNSASHGQLPATAINYVVVAMPKAEGGTVPADSDFPATSRLPNTEMAGGCAERLPDKEFISYI